ncbi:hypothetical protein C8F04DRAFT_1194751 [Mycena alexandri]|uniref:Uncharacterized protein n=1 Tax=Mycena alexandri TaxID=1745969 RepID=A0AAD6S6U8_9AGAR|nr:hypothetical protein C8F04DRAFT_1194751 [Mycena alexandri]
MGGYSRPAPPPTSAAPNAEVASTSSKTRRASTSSSPSAVQSPHLVLRQLAPQGLARAPRPMVSTQTTTANAVSSACPGKIGEREWRAGERRIESMHLRTGHGMLAVGVGDGGEGNRVTSARGTRTNWGGRGGDKRRRGWGSGSGSGRERAGPPQPRQVRARGSSHAAQAGSLGVDLEDYKSIQERWDLPISIFYGYGSSPSTSYRPPTFGAWRLPTTRLPRSCSPHINSMGMVETGETWTWHQWLLP